MLALFMFLLVFLYFPIVLPYYYTHFRIYSSGRLRIVIWAKLYIRALRKNLKLKIEDYIVSDWGRIPHWDNTKTPPRVYLFGIFIMVWPAKYYVEILNKVHDSRNIIQKKKIHVIRVRDYLELDWGCTPHWDSMKTPHKVYLFEIFIMVWLAHYCVEILNNVHDSGTLPRAKNPLFRIWDCVVLPWGCTPH